MPLRLVQANLKARDDVAVGRFWADALGWRAATTGAGATSVTPDGFDWTSPDAPVCVDVVAVPDPRAVRHRVHLDLATTSHAHQADLVGRLRNLGATPVDSGQGDVPWTVLADPEGNTFRVREPRDAYRDTGPIAALVVDCAAPRFLARFWAAATGWTTSGANDDVVRLRSPRGTGPHLEFVRTATPTAPRHRIHLDLVPHPGHDQEAEATRLRHLGASPARTGPRDVPWIILTDPEGNEFCVLAPP